MIFQISGIRDIANIAEVEQTGAQWLAFDFVKNSPRFMPQIISRAGFMPDYSSLHDHGPDAEMSATTSPKAMKIGIFHDEMVQTIVTKVVIFKLDIIQFNGDESTIMLDNLRRTLVPDLRKDIRFMKTIAIKDASDVAACEPYVGSVDYFRFDLSPMRSTDARAEEPDWSVIERYRHDLPFMLAGDIGIGDIPVLRSLKHPRLMGIDLNESVESEPAVKDPQLVQTIIKAWGR